MVFDPFDPFAFYPFVTPFVNADSKVDSAESMLFLLGVRLSAPPLARDGV